MPRAELLRQRAPKKTNCMPTHLADEEAQLDARVSGYTTEQHGRFVLCERGERKGRKNGR